MLAGFLGLISVYIGAEISVSTTEPRQLANQLKSLSPIEDARRGQRVIVSGRVAPNTPTLLDEFVAYRRTEYKCPTPGVLRCTSRDVEVGQAKQSMVIDTVTGPVQITNKDYRFDDRPSDWFDIKRIERQAGLTTFAVTLWGFGRNSPVVVVGVIKELEPQRVIHAETLMAGPVAKLIEELETGDRRLRAAAPYLLLIGLLMVCYAGWEMRRIWRA